MGAQRLAKRLQVLGPRWDKRSDPRAVVAVEQIRSVLQDLADAAALAEGLPIRKVPDLAARSFADQVVVLATDLARYGSDDQCLAQAEKLRQARLDH